MDHQRSDRMGHRVRHGAAPVIPTGRISIFAGKSREPIANDAEIIL